MLAPAGRFETGEQVCNMAGNIWRARRAIIHDTMDSVYIKHRSLRRESTKISGIA